MRIVNLASGSKGNSTFISFGDTKILIDVGLTLNNLEKRLNEIDESLTSINAIFITHEHIDHIRSLKQIAKKYNAKVFMHKKLAESDALKDFEFKEGNLFKFENKKIEIGDLEVLPFEISHDAVAPVGYVVNVKNSLARVGFVTDLGIVTEKVKNSLCGVKMIFLESNHDEEMLFSGRYPKIVKERIASNIGHLSNNQSLEFAKFLYENGTRCFVLSHLSENNNTIEKAFSNYTNYFKSIGLELDRDIFIRVSFQDKHGNNFNLKEEFYGIL